MEASETQLNDPFMLIPANGGGSVVQRSQIAGARPNGEQGSIIYLKSGPSVYTTLSTKNLAEALDALVVGAKH